MQAIPKIAVKLSLTLGLLTTGLVVPGCGHTASATVIRTTDQGVHEIRVANGRLVAVVGTYQDMQVYKRSVSAYFVENNSKKWLQVPVVESEVDYTKEWFHLSQGETTQADAAIVANGSRIVMIIVERSKEKNKFRVNRYIFREGSDENPFDPPYIFGPQSSKIITGKPSDSVETLLDAESSRQQ